jgi:hypothetical protein
MIIKQINGFKLCRGKNKKDFYYVILPNGETMTNLSGTKNEIITELQRWKKEVDFNNPFMFKVENALINALKEVPS